MKKLILAVFLSAVSLSALANNADCDFIALQQYNAMMDGAAPTTKDAMVSGFKKQCLTGVADRLKGENPTGVSAFIMGKLAMDKRYRNDAFYRDGATSAYVSYLRGYSETIK